MIPRSASTSLARLAKGFPILALTGPSQSGKITLAKAAFANKPYVSLENPDEQDFVERDPKAFLARFEHAIAISTFYTHVCCPIRTIIKLDFPGC